ncbi:MAG: cobalt ECF transporter T component CbiQ [Methanosarcinales archaeon]
MTINEINFERLEVQGDSLLHRLDARVKLISVFALIFGIVAINHWQIPISIFLLCLILIQNFKIPIKTYLNRLRSPLMIATVVFIVVVFTYSGSYQVWNLVGIPIYQESIDFAILLFFRIIAAVSVLNLFLAVTPITDVMDAMQWFRIPKVIVDLTAMMLRYIHLLSKESAIMYKAQQSRCGYSNKGIGEKIRQYSTIASTLLIRTFNRTEKIHNAMLSRGYNLESRLIQYKPLSNKDLFIIIFMLIGTILLLIIDRAFR